MVGKFLFLYLLRCIFHVLYLPCINSLEFSETSAYELLLEVFLLYGKVMQ